METILRISNLHKRFHNIHAVNNVSFDIHKGNVYGILGPNGSGKSTTLGIVLNVVNKTSGTFEWFSGSVDTYQALKKVGAIIERPNFYPYLSAYENLKLVCLIKDVAIEKIDEKLNLVGLFERKNSKFSTFSLGMKQRLAIASALLNDPEILILDEPTNGLDPQGIRQIRELITKIAATGTTILLASHLLDEVEKVCSHVVVLNKGKMRYAGSVKGLQSQEGFFELVATDLSALQSSLNNIPEISHTTINDGKVYAYLKTNITAENLNKYLFQKGIVLSHLVKRKESLEEQFIKLTA